MLPPLPLPADRGQIFEAGQWSRGRKIQARTWVYLALGGGWMGTLTL